MKRLILTTSILVLGLFIGTSSAVEFILFGPSQYSRTKGNPNLYDDTFLGTTGQGKLILTNGTADGKNRVSSASIVVNGQEVLGPSNFNQQVYDLEVPINLIKDNSISVKLQSKPGSYITVKITEEVAVDATATEVIGPEGGIVSVQNHLGDTVTLEIPLLALTDSTPISITALASPPPNPFATNIYPGIILEPSGLILSTPIKIRVDFHDALPDPEVTALFWLKDSSLALGIPNQTATQNSIEGEITHFSTLIGAQLSSDELWALLLEIKYRVHNPSAWGILDSIADYLRMMWVAKAYKALDQPEEAKIAEDNARGKLEEDSLNVLSAPLPNDPCGQYSCSIKLLADLVQSALGDPWLAEQINKRSCTFNVLPQFLFLDPEETWLLTAKLLDPNGNQRSCSSLNWYSSNLNAVEIALTINDECTVKAANEGSANISANCDGLLAYAEINVTPGVDRLEVQASLEKPPVNYPIQLTVIARNPQGDVIQIEGSTITWSSNKPLATSFNPQTGLSTTLVVNQLGPVTVTASYKNGLKTASTTICARAPIATIEVSTPSNTLFVGNTVHLTATAKNANGSSEFGCDFSPTFTWYSSNLNVATVDQNGNVRGVSKGVANISAVYGSKFGYSQITVFDMTGTWYHREYWQSSTCPENTYEVAICTVNQTGNLLTGTYNGVAYYTGHFTGPTFNWTLIAPYWLNQYAMVTSSSMTGTVSADGLHYLTSDSWTASYIDEKGVWQSCYGFSRASADRL